MIRKIEDFQRDWQYETEATTKLLRGLTDASLNQKVTEDGRTLGFLAWHLVTSFSEMLGLVGLQINVPSHTTETPTKAEEIVAAFEIGASSVIEEVVKNWTDETLLEEDSMYGETWKRGLTLLYLMLHQAHHRGQITVLMRQANLPVSGIYGPAKEEWEAMGMAAMR